jgi:hypothetical protein
LIVHQVATQYRNWKRPTSLEATLIVLFMGSWKYIAIRMPHNRLENSSLLALGSAVLQDAKSIVPYVTFWRLVAVRYTNFISHLLVGRSFHRSSIFNICHIFHLNIFCNFTSYLQFYRFLDDYCSPFLIPCRYELSSL